MRKKDQSGKIEHTGEAAQAGGRPETEHEVMPVVEEQLHVGKRTVAGDKVVVHKTVHERREVVDPPLAQEQVTVERVPVNRIIEAPAQVRQEGDVTIVPVMEEVLVVEKRLVLKEELHITRERGVTHQPIEVTLRHEEAQVERIAPTDEPRARKTA